MRLSPSGPVTADYCVPQLFVAGLDNSTPLNTEIPLFLAAANSNQYKCSGGKAAVLGISVTAYPTTNWSGGALTLRVQKFNGVTWETVASFAFTAEGQQDSKLEVALKAGDAIRTVAVVTTALVDDTFVTSSFDVLVKAA